MQGSIRTEEGGGGSWTHTCVYQKWPDNIFAKVNFVFSHDGHFGPEGGATPSPF